MIRSVAVAAAAMAGMAARFWTGWLASVSALPGPK